MSEKSPITNRTDEHLAISTTGEIADWLTNDAVGSDPYAASYLANMRRFIELAKQEAGEDSDQLLGGAYTLASTLGQRSEKKYQLYGKLRREVAGVSPLREVTAGQILANAVDYDANHPNYKGYADSEIMLAVHDGIDGMVREEISRDQEQAWINGPNLT